MDKENFHLIFLKMIGRRSEMSRKQRLRICCNLLQMVQTAKSDKLRKSYRNQYDQMVSRIKQNNPSG